MSDGMFDNRGSIWRKWDLHIHCPSSALNNKFEGNDLEDKWKKYLTCLEDIDDVSVLGITDYFSLNGYKKVCEFKDKGRLSKFDLILPNCELRITPVTRQERAINFHFIFNPKIVNQLDSLFFSKLEFEYEGEPYLCKERDLIRLGRRYKNDLTLNERTAYKEGVNQFKVSYKQLSKLLKNSKKLRKNSLTGVSNSNQDGNSGIQHSSLAATREEIYRIADFIFSSNPNDVKYFLGQGSDEKEEVERKYGSIKPCIHGSDAHELDKICTPDLDRFTWIKSDPTFEGFRQIIFEPKYRVQIRSDRPNEPLIKINKVNLNLPDDSELDNQDYCLKGNYDIQFSPFFTCLIGGRGTGKSSILNLIDHSISDEENDFFKEHKLTDGNKSDLKIEEIVSLDEKSEKGDLEFLSQNEIEDFAQDQHRFTQAIYKRLLKLDSEDEIEESVREVNTEITKIDNQIIDYKELKTLRSEINSLQKGIEKNENILASLQDEDYQKNSQNLSDKTKRLKKIRSSRHTLKSVLTSIHQVQEKIPEELDDTIAFERALDAISESLEEISDEYNLEQLSEEVSDEVVQLENDKEKITDEINKFLKDKGLSQENLKEASAAKTNLDSLKDMMDNKKEKSQKIKGSLKGKSLDKSSKHNFEEVISEHLGKVNEKFETIDGDDQHVKEIKLEYEFNYEKARENLREKVRDWIKESNTNVASQLRKDHLKNKLFIKEPLEVNEQKTFLEELQSDASKISDDLLNHFEDEYNFLIYKLMIAKEFYNAEKYKRINVFYDGRPIRNTSFGQRCTAAIVILLSLGNNPIIIDEPEAHLDSALIADNLVNLIKNTKSQRQIIFATHNANFVVNGDAELVHVLWIDEDDGNKMKITSTTIEDLKKRSHLFALEGGEEAFKQREVRYNL